MSGQTQQGSPAPPTPSLKSTLRDMLRPRAWGILEGSLLEHQELLGGLEADCSSQPLQPVGHPLSLPAPWSGFSPQSSVSQNPVA